MLGNPNADNPFATSDPFGPSRVDPVADDFDNVDFGNNPHQNSSGLYSGPGVTFRNAQHRSHRTGVVSSRHSPVCDWSEFAVEL